MTEKLREELLRIGDGVPQLHVPGDVWARGRQLRRRDRALTGVAAMSVVALICAIALIGWPGQGRDRAVPVTSPEGPGAVPAMLHGVPERLIVDAPTTEDGVTDSMWAPEVVETELAVGRASVAFGVSNNGGGTLPMVVTAHDGAYHPLALPGWSGASLLGFWSDAKGVALALSPDGRSLAYPWWDPTAPVDGPMPAGLRIVDLETGQIREIALQGGDGVFATQVVWSPDSRWLAWSGEATFEWTPTRHTGGRGVVGRIAPGATVSETVPVPWQAATQAVAIASSGVTAVVASDVGNDDNWVTWDGRALNRGRTGLLDGGTQAAFGPDGRSVLLSTRLDAMSEPPWDDSAWVLDTKSGRVLERPLAEGLDLYPEGAEVRPLGWMNEKVMVAMVTTPQAGDRTADVDSSRVVLMTAPSQPRGEWTYRLLTEFDHSVSGPFAGGPAQSHARTVTVAVDLMSLGQPTADFPRPDWPWSDERKAVVFGLVALLALGGLLVGRGWLRARRRALR